MDKIGCTKGDECGCPDVRECGSAYPKHNDGYVPITDLVATSPDAGGGYVFV